jgi:hypothetical protein
MLKNVAGQIVPIFAYDSAAQQPKTNDQANITAYISKDGNTTLASTNDTNPTQYNSGDAAGMYFFNMTKEESNCDHLMLYPTSSTPDVVIDIVSVYPKPDYSDEMTTLAARMTTLESSFAAITAAVTAQTASIATMDTTLTGVTALLNPSTGAYYAYTSTTGGTYFEAGSMDPIDITLRFMNPMGSPAYNIAVFLKLNGNTMVLQNGTHVSTQELSFATDSNGEVTLPMFNENQFNEATARGLDNPPSYTLRIPHFSLRRVVALPGDSSNAADLVDIESIEKADDK